MRKIIFLITILILVSCKKENTKNQIEAEGVPIVKSVSKVINRRDFPLKNFSKIELVSYYDRIRWDTLKYKGKQPFRKELVDNFKLTFDSTMIQERVILNKSQERELLNLMISDTCVPEEMSSACYDPRHMILFRDDKNRIIGYNEFCINCIGSRSSTNLDGFQKYCYSDMSDLFRKFGIKLFVEYEDGGKEYEFLRKKGYLNYKIK
ncbi:hypothetical protein FNW52_04975 [Flavobacterium sp. ZT3R18]|uniref:hypothetical protein n=1 Tax=Flavobacterium sp. ZT3R18 TaxID=2594429 RepID=UPI001179F842|nr:hypothetical protein [Flavobacterium sp. ZT3R18]TRX37319.1 hypothetical protein FNW52_04975 [Flavobacterium sp. ZT3R18]